MSKWLDPLRATLDALPQPVSFFFRDDDGGWDDESLFKLIDIFAGPGVPIDLAVIPKALSTSLATRLSTLQNMGPDLLSIHQHGYAHLNHEREGRKCEFGVTRPRARQISDIEAGKRRLDDLCGAVAVSIFTPPWNRCTGITADCLIEAGFGMLSRDVTATQLNIQGLMELPISVDWFARRKGVRLGIDELGTALAGAVSIDMPTGVMLHHAEMDQEDRRRVSELLRLIASHPRAQCRLMEKVASELREKIEETDRLVLGIGKF